MKQVKRTIAIIAVLVMLVSLSAGLAGCKEASRTTVVLEASSVTQLTVDANTVVDTSDALNGSKLDKAISSVIGEMIQNGELTETDNTVLISVSTADLQETLVSYVSQAFQANSFTGAAICQTAEDAAQGKAQLIGSLIAANDTYSTQELEALSVNQLMLLCETNEAALQGISLVGTASQAAYVGVDTAQQVALINADTTADAVTDLTVLVDYNASVMFYSVRFKLDGSLLETYIDAVTGELMYSGVVGGERLDVTSDEITEEMALAAACISSNVDATAVENVSCEFMDFSSQPYYMVRFTCNGTAYEVMISSLTGKPLEGDFLVDSENTIPDETVSNVSEETTAVIQEGNAGSSEVTEPEDSSDETLGG